MLFLLGLGIDCLRAAASGVSRVVKTVQVTLTQVGNVGRGIQNAFNEAAFPPEPPSPQWDGWDLSNPDECE